MQAIASRPIIISPADGDGGIEGDDGRWFLTEDEGVRGAADGDGGAIPKAAEGEAVAFGGPPAAGRPPAVGIAVGVIGLLAHGPWEAEVAAADGERLVGSDLDEVADGPSDPPLEGTGWSPPQVTWERSHPLVLQ